MRLLTVLFLRLFAMNLGRSYRNAPAKAFDDAVAQLSAISAIPVAWMIAEIWPLIPWLHRDPSYRTLFFIIAIVIFVFPASSWLERRFTTYKQRPEAADPYRTERERIKTTIGYLVSVPILVFLVIYSS